MAIIRNKTIHNFRDNLMKTENDLVLDNLINEIEIDVFKLHFVQKMSKIETQNELKLSRRKFDKIYNSLVAKVYKIKELGLKNNVYEMPKAEIIRRCNELEYSEFKTKFCIYAYYEKLTKREIADKMCLDIDTVRKYRTDYRKELESI